MEKAIPSCPTCGVNLKWNETKQWFACPNWKPNDKGCKGFIFNPSQTSKGGFTKKTSNNEELLIALESLQKQINKRFDDLGRWLVTQSEMWKK